MQYGAAVFILQVRTARGWRHGRRHVRRHARGTEDGTEGGTSRAPTVSLSPEHRKIVMIAISRVGLTPLTFVLRASTGIPGVGADRAGRKGVNVGRQIETEMRTGRLF